MFFRFRATPSLLSAALVAVSLAACGGSGDSSPPVAAPMVQVVSASADLVTGGDALIDVALPERAGALSVKVNGTDVSSSFKADPLHSGHLLAKVTGLTVGANTVLASAGGNEATLKLTNYPLAGPVISGPHQTPFICQTSSFVLPDGTTLGAATDADCSITTRIQYLYMKTGGTALTPMTDLTAVPSDADTATTTSGVTVPFIVRVETSTVDRGIYQSAVLHNPVSEVAPTPITPPKGWNRRLIAVEGFGCPAGWYIQGAAQGSIALPGVLDFTLLNIKHLRDGYATFANTLQHASNNCNAVLASEAAMMSKEHFIETYGVPSFTVSAGCSGGSYGSSQLADRIPGLFDGVLIACTFPDPLSIAFSGSDGHLISHYRATNPGALTDAQVVAVTGYKGLQAFLDAANQAGRTDPISGRADIAGYAAGTFNAAVPAGLRYDPVANPTGARATVYDAAKNIYGVDPVTKFALRPYDNVGVQYGLAALNAGTITVDQFLDLNEKVGGYDQDANYVAGRSVGDAGAMLRAQQSGLQLGGNGGLASIPVLDITGIYNDDGGYHYQWFHFAMRDRLAQANGNADNHVMWRGNPVPFDMAWAQFITWVDTYKKDTSSATQRAKVISAKPLQDGCWRDSSTFYAEKQTLGTTADVGTVCNTLFPSWTFPRRVAGGPVSADIPKCTLKAVAATDYVPAFSPAQMTRLNAIFPSGVCDWSKPGNRTGVVPNGSFGPSPLVPVFDITKS